MTQEKRACTIPDDDPTMLALRGYELDEASASQLERALKRDPTDLVARLKLLAYYMRHSYRSKPIARKHLANVLWLIENVPAHPILGEPWASIHRSLNPAGYEKCKRLWLKQIRRVDSDVAIVTNAASFLHANVRLAERLYRQAIEIKPNDSRLYRDLAFLLRLGARKKSERMKRAFAAQRQAVTKEKEPQMKRYLLDDLAEIAFDIGEWSIARKAAQKSVAQAMMYRDWYTGNAIHHGNTILGRLALADGDIKKALFYLKEASKTPGSPQLNSFGPNMILAQELLERRQRKPVVSYLKACKKFWEGQSTRLDACIKAIERGETPKLPKLTG